MTKYAGQEETESILAVQSGMESERTTWESHWGELAKYVIPEYEASFVSPGINHLWSGSAGEKKHFQIFDTTAMEAIEIYIAVLESMLVPRAQIWHTLQAMDPELRDDREVQLWFEQVNQILFKLRYGPGAHFSEQVLDVFFHLGVFGTGCLWIDFDPGKGFSYRSIPLSEVYIQESHRGDIDYVHRRFTLTARQAVGMFSEKVLPEAIVKAAVDPHRMSQRFEFVHCVKPDPANNKFPFRSIHIARAEKKLVQEGGFRTFPYAVSRERVISGETYGRSPMMRVLPNVKIAGEISKVLLKQAHRTVDPVMLTADDGVLSLSLRPGAVNAGGVSPEGRPLVHTLPVGNFAVGEEQLKREQMTIRRALFNHVLDILVERPRQTATEVMQRAQERDALLTPLAGRQQTELLGPMIRRELDLLQFYGVLPEVPQILRESGGTFEVVYESPIAQAQKAGEVTGVSRMAELLAMLASSTGDPGVWDHLDVDVIVPRMASAFGVPPSFMSSMETIQAQREGRNQQMQQQQMVEAMPGAAAMMKAVQPGGM